MNVRAFGSAFELKPADYLSLVPTRTTCVWIGTKLEKDNLSILGGAILPPEVRNINLSYYKKDAFFEYSAPSILWTYSILPRKNIYGYQASHDIECRLFLWKKDNHQLLKKAYRIGNVCHDGRVCWGSSIYGDPANLREANIRYWRDTTNYAYLSSGSHRCPLTEMEPSEVGAKRAICQESYCQCCHRGCNCWSADPLQTHQNFIVQYDIEKNNEPWAPLEITPNTIFTDKSPDGIYLGLQDIQNPILGWVTEEDQSTWQLWTSEKTKIISKKEISSISSHRFNFS